MGIVFRQSVKTTIVAIFGAVLGAVIMWMSTNYFPNREFGFTRNLTLQAVNLCQLLTLGLQSTLVVYIHKYADQPSKRKALLTICLGFPTVTLMLFSVLYALIKPMVLRHTHEADIALTDQYYYWLPIFGLLFVYQSMLELFLASQMKNAIAAFMREIVVRVFSIGTILLYAFGVLSFPHFVAAMVLLYLVPVAIFFLLSYSTKIFGLTLQLRVFSKTEYKDIIHFSWYHFLLTIALTVIGGMDSLMLPFSDKKGFSDSGIYALALFFISFIQLPSKAMISPTMAVMAKAYADDDMVKVKDVFNRSSLNILIATIAMALIIICNLHNAVAVIKSGYEQLIPVCMILFIGRFIDLATGVNDLVLSIAKYYKFNFYLALILLPVFYLLLRYMVHRYGIYGAAWSSAIIYVSFNMVKFLFVWYKLGIQPFSMNTVLVVIAAIPALLAGYFLPPVLQGLNNIYLHASVDAIVRSGVIAIIYVLMLLLLKPSADLQEYIASIRKHKRLF